MTARDDYESYIYTKIDLEIGRAIVRKWSESEGRDVALSILSARAIAYARKEVASERQAHERTKRRLAEWKRWADVACRLAVPASQSFLKRPDEEP